MKSISRTAPSGVSHSDSRISESPRYRRRAHIPPEAGASRQNPARSSPSRDAKQAGESNRGRHSQSIDPSQPTSAAVCVSPSSP